MVIRALPAAIPRRRLDMNINARRYSRGAVVSPRLVIGAVPMRSQSSAAQWSGNIPLMCSVTGRALSTHGAVSRSGISTNESKPKSSTRPRKHRVALSEEIDRQVSSLEEKTRQFLDESPQLSETAQATRIMRLITDWGKLWGQSRRTHRKYIARGAVMTDKIVHVLLDLKGKDIRNKILNDGLSKPMKEGKRKEMDRTETLCNIAITGWAKSGASDAGQRAQSILDRMEAIYTISGRLRDVQPTYKTFNATMDAWAKSNDGNACEMGLSLLHRMGQLHASGVNSLTEPDQCSYNNVMNAYAQKGDAANAEIVLGTMESLWMDGNEKLIPDAFSYSIVINALAKSGKPDAAKRAEDIVHRMLSHHERTGDARVLPNDVTFGTLISLHANTRQKHSASNAERVLDWLIGLYKKGYAKELRPIDTHFVTVMNGYAKMRTPWAAQKAQDILTKMDEMYRLSGFEDLKPNHQCLVICIDAWAKSRQRGAAEKAEKLLSRLEELYLRVTKPEERKPGERINAYGYNIVMDCWARSGERGATQRVEQILGRMRELANEDGNEQMAPDKVSYTSLMRAIIKEREPGFLKRSMAVLSEMEELAAKGDTRMKPDAIAYATVLSAFAKEGKVRIVEQMLHRMKVENVQPNTFCFNILMSALANSNEDGAARKAEEVLLWMDEEHRGGFSDAKPHAVSFVTCINALAKSNDKDRLDRAERLFKDMIKRYEAGDAEFNPELDVFNSLLNVIARSDEVDKVNRALEMLSRIRDAGLTPDRISFNTVLSACAHVTGGDQARQEALRVTVNVFNSLRSERLGADSYSYVSLLHICCNLIDDEVERCVSVEDLFRKCCEDGRVDQRVLSALRRAAPEPLFWKLIGKEQSRGFVKVADLPLEWSRNAAENKRKSFRRRF